MTEGKCEREMAREIREWRKVGEGKEERRHSRRIVKK